MQKSLCFHVCVNKKGSMCHVITLRTLLDAHGPKEVSESKQYDLTTYRKFFHASQSQGLDSLTCNFCSIHAATDRGKVLLKTSPPPNIADFRGGGGGFANIF